MKVVLIANGFSEEMAPLLKSRPSSLLQVVDKPFIAHIIESLLQQGFDEISLVVSYLPELIEDFVGDGSRWGIHIQTNRVENPKGMIEELKLLLRNQQEDVFLLGLCDLLPSVQLGSLLNLYEEKKEPILIHTTQNLWTGWGLFPVQDFLNLSSTSSWSSLALKGKGIHTSSFLSVQSYRDLLRANEQMLSGNFSHHPFFPAYAKQFQSGIWISHGASISHSAKLIPPVFVGEHCHIKPHVELGPNTVIESNCVIDKQTTVKNSIICAQSYVGEALEIHHCIVDKNLLINLPLQTHTVIQDDILIGEMPSVTFWKNFWLDLKKLFRG